MLGGSSAVNYNMFSMASRQDLDNWVALGNEGWGFDDLAPYYRKFETYNPPSAKVAEKFKSAYVDPLLRGTEGPIQVMFVISVPGSYHLLPISSPSSRVTLTGIKRSGQRRVSLWGIHYQKIQGLGLLLVALISLSLWILQCVGGMYRLFV